MVLFFYKPVEQGVEPPEGQVYHKWMVDKGHDGMPCQEKTYSASASTARTVQMGNSVEGTWNFRQKI